MHNGNLLAFEAGSQRGFGVRVLYRGAWGFAAGSDLDAIPAVFTRALDNAKTAALRLKRPIRLADKQVHTGRFSSLKALKTFASLSKSFFCQHATRPPPGHRRPAGGLPVSAVIARSRRFCRTCKQRWAAGSRPAVRNPSQTQGND